MGNTKLAVGEHLDTIIAIVNQMMMVTAEVAKIWELGLTSLRPELEVMALHELAVTARPHACGVASVESASNRRRNLPRFAPDV